MSNLNLEKGMASRKEMFGHPVGLYILFFTEMWERFSLYGMRSSLTLFIVAPLATGGLAWDSGDSLSLLGWYGMMVYVMGIPGGILADRVLGQKKSVMLGGLFIIIGHAVLMIPSEPLFFVGLACIILGVGSLKPNISTMVGGLYAPGDVRRDQGFTIFYIGINVGAVLSSTLVPLFVAGFGWRAGFGLAGAGMLLGQIVYILGLRHLEGVGDLRKAPVSTAANPIAPEGPLSKIEIDRMIVMIISFIFIIVFWGAFEQAGGLLNLYAQDKIDRNIFSFEIPAGVFQSVNAWFIILLGTVVGAFWMNQALKGRESSTLFKMALGTMIMGLGFGFMVIASMEAATNGKGAMFWLILAYLFHTVGELCASPTGLSFVTKLAPPRYASLMMGMYFAAIGFGNKLAGMIGESSQSEPIKIEMKADALAEGKLKSALSTGTAEFISTAAAYPNGGNYNIFLTEDKVDFAAQSTIGEESKHELSTIFAGYPATASTPLEGNIRFKREENGTYVGKLVFTKVQNDREYKTFLYITLFTVGFGMFVLLFLKKLKALTHGAEDIKKEEE